MISPLVRQRKIKGEYVWGKKAHSLPNPRKTYTIDPTWA